MTSDIKIEFVEIEAIKNYGKNARKHSKKQIDLIAASIAEFGFTNPIIVDEHNEILAGHGRLAAAKKSDLKTVPVVRRLGLDDAQKRTYRIADNRLAERSTWSPDLLTSELGDLVFTDIDLTLSGFDAIEIDKMLTREVEPVDDEAPIAPPPLTPVTQVGDLWKLGPHRILCGDARHAESYATLLGEARADVVIADPPYNLRVQGHVSGKGKTEHTEFAMASGEMDTAEFRQFLKVTLGNARDFSRQGSLHFVFMDWRSIADLVAVGQTLFDELKNIIAWIKPNGAMGAFYRSQHERVAFFKLGTAPHTNNVQLGRMGRNRSNVWQYPGGSGFFKTREQDLSDHPTPKPIKLIADAIRDASDIGGIILDPFGGAGTTLLAADKVGRLAALIEIEPKYVDVALRRYQEQTGIEPILLPHGTPLSEVRQQRIADDGGAND